MNRILLTLGIVLIFKIVSGQTRNFIDQPYIETTAKFDTLVSPDRIYLSILLSESGTKGKQTVEELERNMANRLSAIGLDLEKQLSLRDVTSNFKKYFLKTQDILKAKAYSLLVYNANTAGQVIYEMEKIGISNISIERTEYFKMDELKLMLKAKAAEKAKKQAESIAKSLNQTIGKAIHITDFQADLSNALQGRASGLVVNGNLSRLEEESAPISIEFEKIKVESNLNVTFILN
ncbi:SIMPL domain-containing protein [Marinilongibacter aquaticus]|uniref:SIMPL domain-containing protein n=1 Tax=Marinilongibacter aquaticus TaxID=2975157 RepID=UPI0021BD8D7E|nr:SIMPL domain-containing protein [Marinilongibacter aquaticus]UBM59983.1 SIMPL domain-containing protein [Marinilongibacter aquaticus]